MRVLLTSGGTKVPIDSVRHIGTFGRAIGIRGLDAGWALDFVYAEGSRAPHLLEIDIFDDPYDTAERVMDLRRIIRRDCYESHVYKDFKSYQSLLNARINHIPLPDVIVLAAAVSDYGTVPVDGKIRSKSNLTIELEPLPKIISGIRKAAPDAMLVGFKLLVDSTDDELITEATKSIINNHCDLVVANDLRDIRKGEHKVTLVTLEDCEVYSGDCPGAVVRKINEMMVGR